MYVFFCVQEYSTVDLDAVKALLPFTSEISHNKRKLISNYHDEKVLLASGLPTPQPSDSESEDTIADLPLRKRVCSQLNIGDCQLNKVSSFRETVRTESGWYDLHYRVQCFVLEKNYSQF